MSVTTTVVPSSTPLLHLDAFPHLPFDLYICGRAYRFTWAAFLPNVLRFVLCTKRRPSGFGGDHIATTWMGDWIGCTFYDHNDDAWTLNLV